MGRRIKVYDSRKGTTTTDYYGNGDGQKGKVYTVKDHENRTITYTYISTTGQVFSVQNPLGKLQFYAYNDRGQMEKTWGDTTYPVKNDYDAQGRRVGMHTYQSGTAWNGSTWPSPEPTDYQTTWEFDAASGQLKKKTDANGQFVEYTYTPDGRQKTRTWARKINVTDDLVTTYAHNDDTGEMTGITYSDGTPSVTFEYNRLGRQSKVIQTKDAPNGWTHTTTFNLNQYLELESEAITGDIYAKTITRNHQGSGTGLLPGRDGGFSIGNEYSVEYDYDEYGRLNYISGDSLGLPGGAVIYEYVPNSDLVNAVNYLDAGANDLAWTIRAYGTLTDHRDLLTSVENHNGSAVMSKYAYQYDNAGRRTVVLTTGDAFGNGAFNIWDYNDRSELQASNRYNGNQIVIPPDPQTEVTGERRLYHYDPIGNRVDYTFGTGSPLYYCPNGLNQYDSTGVQQSCPQGNPSESFSYDHDGNTTADGTLTYEWDGENRLTAVYPTNPASTSKKCAFTYDYRSRRIRKQVYTRNDNNTAWNTTTSEDWRFVYDQWNVVLVLDGRDGPDEGTAPDNVTVRKYTWGLDLSGTVGSTSSGIHGAGGIGGLLAAVETGGEDDYAYWYLYDGNGNVGQVLDATDTENIITAALYEYDPYGNTIVADGYYALSNPFRFSTKWFDVETELYYYGYRYYSPRLGRWVNKDPIEENDGPNINEYVGNDPINHIDSVGLWTRTPKYWWCRPLQFLFYSHNVPSCKGGPPDARLCINNILNASWIARNIAGRYFYAQLCHDGFDPTGIDGHWQAIVQNQRQLSTCGKHIKNTCCGKNKTPVMLPVPAPPPLQSPAPANPNTYVPWYQKVYNTAAWAGGKACDAAVSTGEWVIEHPAAAGSVVLGSGIVVIDIITVPSGEGAIGVAIIRQALQTAPH